MNLAPASSAIANTPLIGAGTIEISIPSSPKTQRAFRIEEQLTLPMILVEGGFEWKVGDVAIVDASIEPQVGDTVVLADPYGLLIGYVNLDEHDEMVLCTEQCEPMRLVIRNEPTVSEYTFLGTAVELRRACPGRCTER